MWYWGSHGEFVDDANRLPTPGPWGLARYDPDGFALVGALWSGRHASLAPGAASNETACSCDLLLEKRGELTSLRL